MSRTIVECPECGAALPPEAANAATRCPHCEKTSVPIPRPAQPVKVIVEHVVREGALPATGGLQCPRCTGPLFEGKSSKAALHGCGVCGGIWLDNAGSRALAATADPELVELANRARQHAKAKVDVEPTNLACPVCRATLERVVAVNVATVDICASHGTWFDAGELQRVASVFAAHLAEQARDRFEARMNKMVASIEAAKRAVAEGRYVPDFADDPETQDFVRVLALQRAQEQR